MTLLDIQHSPFARRSSRSTGPGVWDKLWESPPSRGRDDWLLAREARSARWALIVRKLQAACGSLEGLNTIELGSGRGDLSALLADRGANVTLLDASDAALSQARQRFERLGLRARYLRGDLFRLPPAYSGRFDVALSSGVVEHFKGAHRTRALRAHLDALNPGGVALVSVPNAWCFPYRFWKLYLELRGCWPYGMELPYTPQELTRRARTAGFVRAEAHCMGFWQSVGVCARCGLLPRRIERWLQRERRSDAARPGFPEEPVGEPREPVEPGGSPASRGSRSRWELPSRLDRHMGMVLLLFGLRSGTREREADPSKGVTSP